MDKEAQALNRLAREQLKYRILTDILMDMEICKLEGRDISSHLIDLRNMLDDIIHKNNLD